MGALVAVLAVLDPVTPTPSSATAVPAPRILLVGDSLTHGSVGDQTWRQRMWRHLADHGRAPDLVGPRDDLWDVATGEGGSHDYVDPTFDPDHAARWGQSLSFPVHEVSDLVEDHDPDVVVELLGTNDLLFLGATVEQVLGAVAELVAEARAVRPDVDVVLGLVPPTWMERAPAVNAGIVQLAEHLDDPVARVVVADTATGYARDTHTWDGLHPNARGEVLLAAGVVDALHELGLGPAWPRPLVDPPLGPRLPAPTTASAGDRSLRVSWSASPGADAHRWWVRDVTAGSAPVLLGSLPSAGTRVLGGLVNGHVYETWVQPSRRLEVAADDVRRPVRVRPLPPLPGRPGRPTGRSPRRDRVVASAPAATGATSYALKVASARTCRTTGLRWRTAQRGLPRPSAVHRTPARRLHVRFVASNLAGPGAAGPSTCVRVR